MGHKPVTSKWKPSNTLDKSINRQHPTLPNIFKTHDNIHDEKRKKINDGTYQATAPRLTAVSGSFEGRTIDNLMNPKSTTGLYLDPPSSTQPSRLDIMNRALEESLQSKSWKDLQPVTRLPTIDRLQKPRVQEILDDADEISLLPVGSNKNKNKDKNTEKNQIAKHICETVDLVEVLPYFPQEENRSLHIQIDVEEKEFLIYSTWRDSQPLSILKITPDSVRDIIYDPNQNMLKLETRKIHGLTFSYMFLLFSHQLDAQWFVQRAAEISKVAKFRTCSEIEIMFQAFGQKLIEKCIDIPVQRDIIQKYMNNSIPNTSSQNPEPVDKGLDVNMYESHENRHKTERQYNHDISSFNGPRQDRQGIEAEATRKDRLLRPSMTQDQVSKKIGQTSSNSVHINESLEPTRRSTRQTRVHYRSPSPVQYAKVDVGLPWIDDLVYQPIPKLKAIVEWEDLHRLNEGEFLNDNLIEFYIKFLQDGNSQYREKVHFFSTHFYSKLTGQKGKIDHKMVERWTKQVDIFNYDYVVIPVNEAIHWYLAIIFNLPNLKRELIEDGIEDGIETIADDGNSEPDRKAAAVSNQVKEDDVKEISRHFFYTTPQNNPFGDGDSSLLTMIEGNEQHATIEKADMMEINEVDETDVTVIDPVSGMPHEMRKRIGSSKVSPRSRSRKSRTHPRKKANLNEPIVVIFDSLGGSHPNTIANLKDYIVAEAHAKRGIEVSRDELKGMNAKGIPQQSNYADCGLFLSGYVEKLLKNPDEFRRKALGHENYEDDYWTGLDPSKMRSHIRDILLELYQLQQYENQKKRREKVSGKEISNSRLKSKSISNFNSNSNSNSVLKSSSQVSFIQETQEERRNINERVGIEFSSISNKNDDDEQSVPLRPQRQRETIIDTSPPKHIISSLFKNTNIPRGNGPVRHRVHGLLKE